MVTSRSQYNLQLLDECLHLLPLLPVLLQQVRLLLLQVLYFLIARRVHILVAGEALVLFFMVLCHQLVLLTFGARTL
jgi:hypothetical protein